MDSLQILHRLIQHFAVEVVSYGFHVAMLAHPQQIPGPTDLQVSHGNFETAAQICEFLDRRQPFLRYFL